MSKSKEIPQDQPEYPPPLTIDQAIALLERFKAEHGGSVRLVLRNNFFPVFRRGISIEHLRKPGNGAFWTPGIMPEEMKGEKVCVF